MLLSVLAILFSFPAPAAELALSSPYLSGKADKPLLLAKNSSFETFDPFVDYNEFQDDEMEKEGINFLKTGRLLTLSIFTGYEGMTFSMRRLYGDALGTFGASISFFFDLQLAMQMGLIFPRRRYLSILRSYPTFNSYYLDFKYYFSKQDLIKGLAFLNPYIIFGPFWLKVSDWHASGACAAAGIAGPKPGVIATPTPAGPAAAPATGGAQKGASPKDVNVASFQGGAAERRGISAQTAAATKPTKDENLNTEAHSKAGFKAGLGIEAPLFKKAFMGLELSYSYAPLPFQGRDLTQYQICPRPPQSDGQQRSWLARLVEPAAPASLQGKRFVGDMINAAFIIGINF